VGGTNIVRMVFDLTATSSLRGFTDTTRSAEATTKAVDRTNDSLTRLGAQTATPKINLDGQDKAQTAVEALRIRLADLAKNVTDVKIRADDKAGLAAVANMTVQLDKLGAKISNPKIDLHGVNEALAGVASVDLALDRLDKKTARPDVDSKGGIGGLLAKLMPGGGAAGGAAGGGGGTIMSGLPIAGGLSPAVVTGGIVAALAALPGAAQAAGGGMVLALGGAMATIGMIGASKTQSVKDSIASLKDHANADLLKIGQPMVPVMNSLLGTVKSTMDKMTPVFVGAMKIIAKPVQDFGNSLIGAFNQPAVRSAIDALAVSFGKILTALAPSLPGIIGNIATGIKKIADAIGKNPQIIVDFAKGLGMIFGGALTAIAGLITFGNWVDKNLPPTLHKAAVGFDTMRHDIAAHMSEILSNIIDVWNKIWTQTVGRAIQIGHDVAAAFNSIKGALTLIWSPIQLVISAAWGVIEAIFKGAFAVITAIWNFGWAALSNTFKVIWAAIQAVIKVAWDVIVGIFKVAIAILTGNWTAAWNAIRNVAVQVWNAVSAFFVTTWNAIKAVFNAAQAFLQAILTAAWNAIKGSAIAVWNALSAFFTTWWNAIKGAWNASVEWIKGILSGAWNTISGTAHTVFNALSGWFGQWWAGIKSGFQTLVNGIQTVWNTVQAVAEAPVRFIVNTVYDKGIVPVVNAVGSLIGLHLNAISFAEGGKVQQGTTSTADDVLVRVSRGETIVSAEHSKQLAPIFAAAGVPGYALGGIPFGGILGDIARAVGAGGVPGSGFIPGAGTVGALASLTGDALAKAASAILNPLLNAVPTGGTKLGEGLKKIPATIISKLVELLKSTSSGGGDIVADAKSWLGKIPYVWGGTAVPGGADCSGFVQTIYKRHGINAPRTSEAQGAWVKRTGPQGGGLAFYHSPAGGADPGHVAIVQDGSWVISQGGGMGPKMMALHGMPLLWTGIPPGGLPVAGAGGGGSPSGSTQQIAQQLLNQRGWGNQWAAFNALEMREAGWNMSARNPSSGAYGLAQFINGAGEYAQYGGNATTAVGQLTAMLNYIGIRYGTPDAAWSHEVQAGWYARGSWDVPRTGPAVVHRGEMILPAQLAAAVRDATAGGGDGHLERLIKQLIGVTASQGDQFARALDGAARRARAY
jgi:phage-related protein